MYHPSAAITAAVLVTIVRWIAVQAGILVVPLGLKRESWLQVRVLTSRTKEQAREWLHEGADKKI